MHLMLVLALEANQSTLNALFACEGRRCVLVLRRSERWLSDFHPKRNRLISHINYRCQGFCRDAFQRATFQLFFARTLDPSSNPAASPPAKLIDNLPWWAETRCHRLLGRQQSIKKQQPSTSMNSGPICFSFSPLTDAALSERLPTAHKVWGWGGKKMTMKRSVITSAAVGECTLHRWQSF